MWWLFGSGMWWLFGRVCDDCSVRVCDDCSIQSKWCKTALYLSISDGATSIKAVPKNIGMNLLCNQYSLAWETAAVANSSSAAIEPVAREWKILLNFSNSTDGSTPLVKKGKLE